MCRVFASKLSTQTVLEFIIKFTLSFVSFQPYHPFPEADLDRDLELFFYFHTLHITSTYLENLKSCFDEMRSQHKKLISIFLYDTLCVESTLLRVEITVVSVVITFVHVEITMRVEITLRV
jgi:hypothetical protein